MNWVMVTSSLAQLRLIILCVAVDPKHNAETIFDKMTDTCPCDRLKRPNYLALYGFGAPLLEMLSFLWAQAHFQTISRANRKRP